MADFKVYSARTVFEGLRRTFHQYLEAQYHIWDEDLIAERRRLLERPGVTFQEPQLEATPLYASGNGYSDLDIPKPAQEILTLASTRANVGIYPSPYAHQAASLEAFLRREEEIIVATGTGSGKTECFLMPILGSLAMESTDRPGSWELPGCRALLLYPMNALVNDQLGRLRRLFGDPEVAAALKRERSRRATFGMYTSRTPYPGMSSPSRNQERIGSLLERYYLNVSPEIHSRLEREGKWPAKDIKRYLESSFTSGPDDSELFSRQEIQTACPDILVTNYSMLEYMLLRPIEKKIFEQTAQWLAHDSTNRFIVVLDEAHMYRGSGGAEVAYLLRRLHSRLRINRDRVRYILTSASLGSSDEAISRIKAFAAELSGLTGTSRSFAFIQGEPIKKEGQRPATAKEADALSGYDFTTLHGIYESPFPAEQAIQRLFRELGLETTEAAQGEVALREQVYSWLQNFGPAALATNLITAQPRALALIADKVFPGSENGGRALESLLALMSFAREEETGRVFAPVRSHLFFRGLPGLFACTNPRCPDRVQENRSSVLGRLFATPQLRCPCGARVYELLTHRDCGAAFIRGYLSDEHGNFLWHEPSTGLWSEGGLLEAHFLVEVKRKSEQAVEGATTWLHMNTGQLEVREPAPAVAHNYIALLRPDRIVADGSSAVLSFNGECPVCLKSWQGTSKIMDLVTKGEAPFAHLVREQVALQPPTQSATEQSPNGGRKALLFSDGRQKAARLARDIPREIEQDVFRQVLLLAAAELRRLGLEALLSQRTYVACLDVLNKTGLQFFDGDDRYRLQQHVREYRKWYEGDLEGAIRGGEFSPIPPPRFTALLLRQLGSAFYSVNALTLAYISPTSKALRAMTESGVGLDKEIALALSVVWLQGFANRFAFDPTLKVGLRTRAAGYPVMGGIEARAGFIRRQQDFLTERIGDIGSFVGTLAECLCEKDTGGAFFIAPGRVKLEVAIHGIWHQCSACTAVSAVTWWGHCPNCLSLDVKPVEPSATSYLRARKGFWRDPVATGGPNTSSKRLPVTLHSLQSDRRGEHGLGARPIRESCSRLPGGFVQLWPFVPHMPRTGSKARRPGAATALCALQP